MTTIQERKKGEDVPEPADHRAFSQPDRGPKKHKASLFGRYIALTTAIAAVVLLSYSIWSYYQQQANVEQQMLAEARVLNTSVMATWKFVDFEQTNINTDRDGTYNFKGTIARL